MVPCLRQIVPRVVWGALLAAGTPFPVQSQGPAAADTAALVLQNRTIFVFRAPLGARSPADRAVAAAERIRRLAELGVRDTVTVTRVPEGVVLAVGNQAVFAITPADLDLEFETLEQAARRGARQLSLALVAERQQRSVAHTVWAIGLALMATVLFVLAMRLAAWTRRRALDRMPEVAGSRLPGIAVRGFTLLSAVQLLAIARRLIDFAYWGLGLFGAYLWLTYVLTRFPYSAPWGEALGQYLLSTMRALILGAVKAIPGLFTVVVIFFATRFVSRVVKTLFEAVESGDLTLPWLHPDTVQPTRRLVSGVLWMLALVVAYPYLPGSDTDVFKGLSVLVGVMISLGSSGVVNQAMSGLVVMYARALKAGDYVRVGDTEGTVVELGILSTKIRTNKREEVTIPNAVLVSTSTKNYSRSADGTGPLLYTSVTIGYDTPWRQVHALLESAARRTPALLTDPPPFVRQTALSDFYVEYQLNAVLRRPEERVAALSALHANIQDAFNEAGVQIMSPHYEGDPAQPKIAPQHR